MKKIRKKYGKNFVIRKVSVNLQRNQKTNSRLHRKAKRNKTENNTFFENLDHTPQLANFFRYRHLNKFANKGKKQNDLRVNKNALFAVVN